MCVCVCVCVFTSPRSPSRRVFVILSHRHGSTVLLTAAVCCLQHLKLLEKKFVKEKVDIGYGSFPYVPLLRCPYYYFIGRKPVH